ncbi:MAG: TetR/AcrR family transcriptional regulator, partial [Chloroflexi bacterium]
MSRACQPSNSRTKSAILAISLTASVPNGTLAVIMNNRENLLKCALEMFAARGYEAVGVQEIAGAAGIKKPTLYHYFGSKSGLLLTLLTEAFEPFFVTLQAAAIYQGDVTITLRAVVGAYFNFARQNPRLYRFYLSMWFAPPDSDPFKVCLAFNERQQQLLETLFTSAANDHGNMKGRQR